MLQSDKAAVAGGPGAANQMVELGGRTRGSVQTPGTCHTKVPGCPMRGDLPGDPAHPCPVVSPRLRACPCWLLLCGWVLGQWLQGKSRCPAPPRAAGWVQRGRFGCARANTPSIALGLPGDDLCLCPLQVPCCHTVPKHPPCMSPNARTLSPPSPLPPSLFAARA